MYCPNVPVFIFTHYGMDMAPVSLLKGFQFNKLKKAMGHSSVHVTENYANLSDLDITKIAIVLNHLNRKLKRINDANSRQLVVFLQSLVY